MTRKHALIVDDSSTAQYRLKMMLRPYDLDINAVDSGEAALRFLEANTPDVIFMDHLMPGMDGFRALQILKSHPETATIPVIMYTSQGGDVYTGQARALGALDVVSKDNINATDLKRVMKMIHIDTLEAEAGTTEASAPAEATADSEASASELSTSAPASADSEAAPSAPAGIVDRRRAPSQPNQDQARALDMRLRKLELLYEDAQRTMTARLVREMQSLRYDIKREIVELAPRLTPAPTTAAANQAPVIRNWMMAASVVLAFSLGLGVWPLLQGDGDAKEVRTAQTQSPLLVAQAGAPAGMAGASAGSERSAEESMLNDLAWAFNQTGALSFNRDSIDQRAVQRLGELVARLDAKGFRGTVEVMVSAGDFCALNNGQGQAPLAGEGVKLGDCALSSRMYGMDRVLDHYVRELSAVYAKRGTGLNLVIKAVKGPEAYPEVSPNYPARDWNAIAQRNNRLEVRLINQPNDSQAASAQDVLAGAQ